MISCGHTSSPPIEHYNPAPADIAIDKDQFNCGPKPANWPDKTVLDTWSTADSVDLANKYWFWGDRCSKLLYYNQLYIECYIGTDLSACADLDALKSKIVKGTTNGSRK